MAPAKILAIKLRALGDTVLMTAPLLEISRAYPQAELHVAVTKAWAPVMEGVPGVRKIWTYERHKEKTARARALARFAYRLRKEKFDCVLNFHASPSTATLAWAIGAKTRSIHFHGHRDRNRYSTVIVPGKGVLKPIIERDMDTLRALGVHVPAGRYPKLFLQPAEIREADETLARLGLEGQTLGLSLGASRPTKSWPIDRFASLAIEWCQKTPGGVLALAAPQETEILKQFLKTVDDLLVSTVESVAQRAAIRTRIQGTCSLSIRGLASILSRLKVLAGNDSGPRHIAVAVDTPTVTLFGPENPFEWHPYPLDRHPYLFIENLPCRQDADPGMPPWCGLHLCTIEEHRCMRQIGVQAVLKACMEVCS